MKTKSQALEVENAQLKEAICLPDLQVQFDLCSSLSVYICTCVCVCVCARVYIPMYNMPLYMCIYICMCACNCSDLTD